jgi:hypothetical protein
MTMFKRYVQLIFIILFLVTGCAADRKSMIVESNNSDSLKSKNSVSKTYYVDTAISKTPGFTLVKSDDLKSALEESLKNSNLYSEKAKANFIIDINMFKLDLPFFGIAPEVTSQINYKITAVDNLKNISNTEITSSGKASFFEGLTADLRVKVAIEKAIKENIKKFIDGIKN